MVSSRFFLNTKIASERWIHRPQSPWLTFWTSLRTSLRCQCVSKGCRNGAVVLMLHLKCPVYTSCYATTTPHSSRWSWPSTIPGNCIFASSRHMKKPYVMRIVWSLTNTHSKLQGKDPVRVWTWFKTLFTQFLGCLMLRKWRCRIMMTLIANPVNAWLSGIAETTRT